MIHCWINHKNVAVFVFLSGFLIHCNVLMEMMRTVKVVDVCKGDENRSIDLVDICFGDNIYE